MIEISGDFETHVTVGHHAAGELAALGPAENVGGEPPPAVRVGFRPPPRDDDGRSGPVADLKDGCRKHLAFGLVIVTPMARPCPERATSASKPDVRRPGKARQLPSRIVIRDPCDATQGAIAAAPFLKAGEIAASRRAAAG
ncbi:hypothetical protein Adu01nite_87790 [Paractinoplanes durhamensis]|uniref:Uncharacterized protein n=1 Tax=Paractinoplanes durhamensis TaxID=113563 RepID=A0ABQ3ZC76_9ACTN|nr:hypothetical protein Adu01nite_87790 [Actinoplanes durhamensis]